MTLACPASLRIRLYCLFIIISGHLAITGTPRYTVYNYTPNPLEIVDEADYHYLRDKYQFTDTTLLSRLEKEILDYEKMDSSRTPVNCDIVFTGSSTINKWKYRIYNDFLPLPVLGRGFGGSSMPEVIFYFSRIMKPYQPKMAVLYCENDIGSGTNRIYELFRYYEYLFHSEFPLSTLYIVSFKPSIARRNLIPQMIEINEVLKNYADIRPNTEFINTFDAMMPNGVLDESLFDPDGLHMNDKGYDLWTSIIKPILSDKHQIYLTDAKSTNNKSVVIEQYKHELKIKSNDTISQICITNLSGVNQLTLTGNDIKSVNTDNLNRGFYIISISNNRNKVYHQKIFIRNE